MTVTVESTTPSAVIDRVSLVLDAFDGPGRLTLAQIVRRTGLPRSSAHRMLERLVQLRWLRRSGRDYELGMRLVELGSLAVHQDRLHRAAIPLLHELHRATGLVVHLAVLDGADVVYLEKIGDRMVAAIPTRVGGRQPAHCTAVGKAILALQRRRRGEPGRPQDQVLHRHPRAVDRRTGQGPGTRRGVRTRGVAARLRLCRRADRRAGRSRRRGVGVRPDESHGVRPAPRCASPHDRDGDLAQRRGRPRACRSDASARCARCGRRRDGTGNCSTREPRPADRRTDRIAGRRISRPSTR